MSPQQRVKVVPAVLRWARETAGFDPLLAARRLRVKPEALASWETGEGAPSVAQLRRAAELYGRPLTVLLLPTPPQERDLPVDFRRTEGGSERSWSPGLYAEFKRAISQREVFLELQELSPGSVTPTNQSLRIGQVDDPEIAARAIRATLKMNEWLDANWGEPRGVLNAAVRAVEGLGILVIQVQRVSTSEMQGFSISDWPFPVIALNGKDPARRRLFTLLHELAHLSMNVSGMCDLHEDLPGKRSARDDVELHCNQVAAAVLMPRDTFLKDPLVLAASVQHTWNLEELADLSRRWGASSEAVLLRLIGLDKATWQLFRVRRPELDAEYEKARQRIDERQNQATGGPNYYILKVRNLGHGYVHSVLDAFQNEAISSRDVATYLDVRFDQLSELQRRIS